MYSSSSQKHVPRSVFVKEYLVPTRVSDANGQEWRSEGVKTTEFTHMRYTAATCDPDEFTEDNGYTLRANLYSRNTELLIAITSYNENKALYARTLHAVMLNIRNLCKTQLSGYWRRSATAARGIASWENITVVLLIDGRDSMDKAVLDLLAAVGVYQPNVMRGQDTVAHIFEYTTQLSIDPDTTPWQCVEPKGDPKDLVPVQMILVIKERNQKKINSHRWLFNAIGRLLKPNVCVLVDAGTRPEVNSIYHLWEAFERNPNLGGCCGEIRAMTDGSRKLLNPLVAAQNFEYKMSNILDKPLESSFGFVTVLPGAFSAYRYGAILGQPLDTYFIGDHSRPSNDHAELSIFRKNMFLAEDRILCFELVMKANEKWTLAYVKHSKADTDVPESTAEFISQRRRWINGSFAASVYAVCNFGRVYGTRHCIGRMFLLHFQVMYSTFGMLFSWFALANLWLTFDIIINLLPSHGIFFGSVLVTRWIDQVFTWIYLACLGLQFILALGNRPKAHRVIYKTTFLIFSVLAAYLLVCSLWLIVVALKTTPETIKWTLPVGALIVSVFSTVGLWLISSVLYGDAWHIISSMPQYLCLASSFTNVLNVYAFCNLHDVSWGTKGSDRVDVQVRAPSDTTTASQLEKAHDGENENQQDIDALYEAALRRALTENISETTGGAETPTTIDDENKAFRTLLVVCWILSNIALAVLVQHVDGYNGVTNVEQLNSREHVYFVVILYATLFLAAVKFIGASGFYTCRLSSFH
ncbi:chitin synthase-domain-containing protein [Cubamyces menziesii]|nr:chitin synthase-domain-containing protein [Cubamyces menziesii]